MDRIFGILIKQANNVIARDADKFAQTLDLTGMQISIIDYISRYENDQNIFQKNIENEFNIRRASATSALKLMEKRDLLVRVPMQNDARLKRLILTPKARRLSEQIHTYFSNTETKISEAVGVENVAAVKQGLKNISGIFED
ncbi:MarR family winged helix-turn-helix transcriptional regulator [Companilactobacillus mishanensis]|uniref:MarR family transcriptional regulator n=1 Tax=Companilactobacillus mishanensis TaxID=2486008 RepID=A0A5P0ZIC2_9LACO|nr:MarR family transcriptional regulator [Companilactobacillus mishanensis]MQS45876.1 MarR family transcriptional regulator [Companilactobacillus mishanensis]MQS52804.1 MarR family transcriptional regulator [Companilactobacillus mishanensis]MQS89941.1 MarR family transcriptional regulator [Companilactobacillus mishanensis]